ncbi:MAG: hypothetical protein HY331_02470 [Chloroflexi bacterium]|nr:hypothetical protein [Chloroflexota bacterium]
MSADTDLVSRSGDLKGALLAFARGPRFQRVVKQQIERRFGKAVVGDEGELINFFDYLVLQHRLPDGRTLVEHFVAAHPELPTEERAMLLGWRDVVEGIFEVERREDQALVAVNLIDELTYRVRSNMGPAVFARVPAGSFLIARLVPVGDEWLLSGTAGVLPASNRTEAYQAAAATASSHPSLVFRNPQRLEQAWELQRRERETFIAFFGSDLIVLPGHQLADRMQAHMRFQMFDVRDAEGKSQADRAEEAYGFVPPLPELTLPKDLLQAETVGVLYDEVDGLNYLEDFGPVQEAFARPELAADRRHRQAVLGYLEDPSISPRLFRRLAEQDPQRASRVFQQVLKQPGFSWERDGEALLRRSKASYFERPVLPGVTPISTRLALAQMAPSHGERARPGGRPPGGIAPAPHGEGKRRKKR